MRTLAFPKQFLWGAAASGPQTEGSADKLHESVMDYWYRNCPQDFYDGIGPDTANDFYHRCQEDLQAMKACGFNSFRTSIQWTRLIRDFETGEPDEKAVDFYRDMIHTAEELGIELILNLHHFDLPMELLDQGGWENPRTARLFQIYAATAFDLFGESVRYWTGFNEPMVIAEAGYLDGFHWPKYRNKGRAAVSIMKNIAVANALAAREYRRKKRNGSFGIILNLTPAIPRSMSKEDLAAADFAELFYNRFFMDACIRGIVSEKFQSCMKQAGIDFELSQEEEHLLQENTVDFVGLNYYHPRRVRSRETELITEEWTPNLWFEDYEKPGVRINPYRGWEIDPHCLYDIAMTVKNEYGNIPWYVSENGMGVEGEERFRDENGIINDQYRMDFYTEHLEALHQAMEEGSACFGFHAWTALDCWSWNNAYKNRYGFISVDPVSQKRSFKKSAEWFRELAESGLLKTASGSENSES